MRAELISIALVLIVAIRAEEVASSERPLAPGVPAAAEVRPLQQDGEGCPDLSNCITDRMKPGGNEGARSNGLAPSSGPRGGLGGIQPQMRD